MNKIGKFTPEEFELMKSHPQEGNKLLNYLPPIEEGDFNKIAKQMTLYHHEKWDGTGYPFGLKEYEIPAYIEFVDELPRNAGCEKIDYPTLEKQAISEFTNAKRLAKTI